MSELELIPQENALSVFCQEDGMVPYVDKVREMVDNFEHDVKTPAGRKKSITFSAKISKYKVAMDNVAKKTTEDIDATKKKVNASRKYLKENLDELRDLARLPVTEYEKHEEVRIKTLQERVCYISSLSDICSSGDISLEDIQENIDILYKIEIDETFEEFQDRADSAKKDSFSALTSAFNREKERARDIEELGKLRKDAADRAEKDRQVAENENARIKAECEAKDKIEHEKAKLAEAKEREEALIRENERIKAQAEQQAKQAVIDERNRQKEKDLEDERARLKLERDKQHVSKIRGEAKTDLMNIVSEEVAKKIVLAISNNEISNVNINYGG